MTTTTTAPETTTVEVPKEEYEMFLRTRRAKLEAYRTDLRNWAQRAIENGARRERVNEALAEMGLPPLVAEDTRRYRARYRVTQYVELNGDHYVSESTDRAEVEAVINRYIEGNRRYNGLYHSSSTTGYSEPDGGALEFRMPDGSWLPADQFWAAKAGAAEEPAPTPVEDLDQLKAIARKWIMTLAGEAGFCSSGVREAFQALELGRVPRAQTKRVQVPVTGQAEFEVAYYEGEDEAVVAQRVAAEQQRILEGGRVYVNGATPVAVEATSAS